MNKIISCVLVLALVSTVLTYSIVKAQSNTVISVSSAEGKPGDTVCVDISISSDKPVVGLECNIEYPTDALQLTAVSFYDEFFSQDTAFKNDNLGNYPYYLCWEDGLNNGITGTGRLAKLEFEIKQSTYNGLYPIDATVINITDYNLEDIYYTGKAGFVTVLSGQESPYSTTMRTTTTKPSFTTSITTLPTTTTTTTTTSTATTSTATTTTATTIIPKNQYKVTIDSAQTIVADGDSFYFPASNANGFIAYTDGTNYYDAGDNITVTGDTSFTTVSLDLTMAHGAAMRLKEKSGIRFYTKVNIEQWKALKELNAEISTGTIIAYSDRLQGKPVTLSTSERNADNKLVYICVPYTYPELYTETLPDCDFQGFVGSLVDIKEVRANAQFIGRGYAKIRLGNYEKTIYAKYDGENIKNNSRSVGYIASRFIKDLSNNDMYIKFKDIVDKYVALYYTIFDPSLDDQF